LRIYAFSIFIALLLSGKSLAGLEDLPVGARSLGMGATYVALANTADAVFLNPGGLSQIAGIDLSFFYQKPFGLEDLNFGTAAISFPVKNHRLSLGFSSFGNGVYREQMYTLSYSNVFQQKLFYGINLRYQTLRIDNYGSGGSLGLDLGFVIPISQHIRWGFFTKNLNRPRMGKAGENLPQIFHTGISTQPTSKLILNFEIYKDVRFPQEVRFGAEFKPFENLALRTGAADNPSRFSAGFGIRVRRFSIDYAFFTHNDLGLTHQMSVSIHFGKKGKQKPREEPLVAEENMSKTKKQTIEDNLNRPSPKPGLPNKRININTATFEELMTLPGIGETLAKRIMVQRENHGYFNHLEDLLKVPGIGPNILKKLEDYLNFGESAQK
jgi:competence ComEA-like helix-hairpin-helix protein